MKIYLTAPIYYRENLLIYLKTIINYLHKEKHTIYSADIVSTPLKEALNTSGKIQSNWFETWRKYLLEADLAVAEISYPGTVNVGFEVASILARGKPVVGLYREGKDPVFLSELHSQRLIKVKYTDKESLEEGLTWALKEAKLMLSRRFTFYIPSEIDQFLEELYREKGVSRSEFIRGLIEKELKKKKTRSQ